MVISQEVSIFIIPALIILFLMKPAQQKYPRDFEKPVIIDVVLVIFLTFCIFPVTSFTGQLNSGLHFPDWLYGIERWMKAKEDNATHLIDLLIASNTFGIMIFNVFMLAVIPAIGEELIFRGVFQKIFYSLFKSGHLAIWITAFVFSALHFQFFGFIPRFILGLLFGYLFYWSGTLWLPVISHFVNNAVPVIGAYIQSKGDFGIVSWEQVIILPLITIIGIIILQYFRNKHKRKLLTSQKESRLTAL
jgi:membrane protease YdiL (CAAX protease family)